MEAKARESSEVIETGIEKRENYNSGRRREKVSPTPILVRKIMSIVTCCLHL